MKKLSIILAIIMALSCFCFTAFADEGDVESTTAPAEIESTTDPAETTTEKETGTTSNKVVNVNIEIIWKDLTGLEVRNYIINLQYNDGKVIKASDILDRVKTRVDATGAKLVDTDEYVISPVVILRDAQGKDGSEISSVPLSSSRGSYDFVVYVFEINDVENLAQDAATELAGKVDWKGIASANTGLINQVIKGAQAAADSLAKADFPEIGEKKTEDAAKKAGTVKGEKVVKTPDTGASAAAGVAVVVLALSATTAVVLRKKED